jgi:ABC-2 type transport system ATP-binding protein
MTTAHVGSALGATGLRKSFGDKVVLDGIDLDIGEGSVFSLVGPNGAGKTSAVRIFSTLLSPDGGEVRIGGFDLARQPKQVRSVIGVTGQFSAVDNLLVRFDLTDAAGKTAATYSGGMRRRLDLAMTLIGDPRLLPR